MNDKGLSPMVATIILIAMVMIIAGILAAGITGESPDEIRQPGIELEGVTENSTSLTIHKLGGEMLAKAYNLKNASPSENIAWNQMELRIAGETASADVVKATSDGIAKSVSTGSWENDINMYPGDILKLENVQPRMMGGDEVRIVWTPTDQLLYNVKV